LSIDRLVQPIADVLIDIQGCIWRYQARRSADDP
jgi:hypothetical protein